VGSTAIVIASYNGERHLDAALDSVATQTHPPVELVVVDDGSTDRTLDVLANRGVRTLTPGHAGAPAARNAGRHAVDHNTDYLLFLDQDDVLAPSMIERLGAWLDDHPEAGMVSCGFDVIGDAGQPLSDLKGFPPRRAPHRLGRPRIVPDTESSTPLMALLDLTAVLPSTTLVRASVFDQVGGWDERHVRGGVADTALAIEIALVSEVHYVPERLVSYRWHTAQESAHRDRLSVTQDAYLRHLRARPEPALRQAWRDYDWQILLGGSARAALEALKHREITRAARITAGLMRRLLLRRY
jgi:GT2 family glycosyltransferase